MRHLVESVENSSVVVLDLGYCGFDEQECLQSLLERTEITTLALGVVTVSSDVFKSLAQR